MERAIKIGFQKTPLNHEGKSYSYLCDIDDVEVGDMVVVEANKVLEVGRVVKTVGLTQFDIQKAHRYVIQRVDLESYERKVKAQEAQREIMNQLRARRNELDDLIIYQELAKNDPTTALLLDKLKDVADGKVVDISVGKVIDTDNSFDEFKE